MTDHRTDWLAFGDRVCLWLIVLAAVAVLSLLALRADRDPPALISPACITTPTTGATK